MARASGDANNICTHKAGGGTNGNNPKFLTGMLPFVKICSHTLMFFSCDSQCDDKDDQIFLAMLMALKNEVKKI